MAIPVSCGPQQEKPATKKQQQKKATRPGNYDAKRSEPIVVKPPPAERGRGPPSPSRNGPAQEAASGRSATTDHQTKKRPEPIQVAKNPPEPASFPIARSPEYQATAAASASNAPSCKNPTRDGKIKESRVESAKNCGAPNAAYGTTDSGDLEPKNPLQSAAAALCKNPTRDGVECSKNCHTPNAAAGLSDSGDLEPKNRLQTAAAASSKKTEEDEGQEEDPAAAVASDSGEIEFCAPSGKEHTKDEEATSVRTSEAWVWSLFSRPWLEQSRPKGPDLRKKTSLLTHLFDCCGLGDLIVRGDLEVPNEDLKVPYEDLKALHVTEKRTLVSEAKSYYKIKESLADKLLESYSSFRVVRGDGECFYRSFIYSYLELVIENDDQSEEDRLLCALENVSIACQSVEWLPYDDFCRSYMAFKDLVDKVKSWKTETRAVRRMLLLSYFRDYRETEEIFSFLRISSAGWLLTHPELSVFFAPEDGTTLEEHCQSQIIRSRSFADHLAISALSDALGIQIQIFSFCIGDNICTAPSGESNAVAIPVVSLVFTGIHYDILYPI